MNPGLRWILIVIGLLAGNVVAVVILMVAAGPASGDRVLPAYYEHAVNHDAVIAEDRASAQLGWSVDAAIAGDAIEVRLKDATGTPLRGARLAVSGAHRAHAGSPVGLALVETGPGVYRAGNPRARAGWWDLTVRSSRDHADHVARLVVEAR
jgi:nitrogen fixation protein FixH